MKTRYLAILATLAFLGFSVSAAAHDCIDHKNKGHKHCGAEPAPSGGGKAFLFEIDFTNDVPKCGGVTDPKGDSFGHVSWSGNVLWDPINIHAHFKLRLQDVVQGDDYPVLGNNDRDCVDVAIDDIAICESDEVVLCAPKSITVKQNQQGRMSGALRLPGCEPNRQTTVWVTVTVDDGDGGDKILRSTPVTVVLPPNEVGTGQSC